MSVYTITPDLLENIDDNEKIYLRDILFVFTNKNAVNKVAQDINGEILDIYKNINNNGDIIKTWLELMSYTPSKFEKINIDLSKIQCIETKFFELCSCTNNKKEIIVYSKQNIKKFTCKNNYVSYKNNIISVLDRDDANVVLNASSIIQNTIINSQIANNGSQINDSTNN